MDIAIEPLRLRPKGELPLAEFAPWVRYTSHINVRRCRLESGFGWGPLIEADLSCRRRGGTAVSDPKATFSRHFHSHAAFHIDTNGHT